MRVYERVAREYAAIGGTTFFALLGEGNYKLSSVLIDAHGMTMRTARHEQGAVAMADGYARVTGRTTLAAVTAGPGFANAAVSIAGAHRGHSKVLIFAGDAPESEPNHFQWMRQAEFARGLDVPFLRVDDPSVLTDRLAEAFDVCEGGRAAILSIPIDVQEREDTGSAMHSAAVARPADRVDPQQVDEALRMVRSAERPVVLIGRGAAAAREEVVEFAHRLGAPMATTLPAIGALAGDPAHLGVCGGYNAGPVLAAMRDADVIVAVGTSLSRYTTRDGAILRDTRIVRIDVDDTAHENQTLVRADAAAGLRALTSALAAEDASGIDAVARTNAYRDTEAFTFEAAHSEAGLDPRPVVEILEDALPHPRYVSVDGGHFSAFVVGMMSWDSPQELMFGLEFGAIGQGLLLSIGAAAAVSDSGLDARVVAATGDGGLLMNVQELESAVRFGHALTVIVFDDQAYGQEVHLLARNGLDGELARIPTPDLAGLARSFGAAGIRVETPEQLADLPRQLREHRSGVLLVNVRIDGDIKNWRIDGRQQALLDRA